MKKLLLISTVFLGLTVNAQIFVAVNNATICAGNCATLTVAATGGMPPYTYSWSPSGQTTQTIVACPSSTTNYIVIVTDANSNVATGVSVITVNPSPTANAGVDVTIISGNSATLTASGGGSYVWSTGSTGATIIVSPSGTTIYCVEVTDANGCTDSACVTVFITPTWIQDFSNNKSVSIFPNPFSSQTTLQSDNHLKNATLTIYNSFGQTVKQISIINNQSTIIHRDNLPSGLYFIHLTENNKLLAVDKLVIVDK